MKQHKIFKLIILLTFIATISGCGAAVETTPGTQTSTTSTVSLTTTSSDVLQPTVSSTSPANEATDVPVNTSITVAFSEAMKSSTITTATFVLDNGVTGTVTYSDRNATFTPSVNLEYLTRYTATILTGAHDASGNGLASNYTWTFTTGADTDTTLPTVSSTSPSTDEIDVPVNASITVTFSEAMKPATITNTSFTLDNGVTGTVAYSGTTATFTPSSNLEYSTIYTATISTAVQDAAGNPMAAAKGSSHSWKFTTGKAPDTTSPTISSTSPVNGATNVSVTSAITATFSETMKASSITTTTFKLSNGVIGAVTYSGTTATFTPLTALAYSTEYIATITTGVIDSAGNSLASNYTWAFTTGVAPDTIRPTISSTSPATGATNVSVNSAITATFSETMAASTISTATFTLDNGVTNSVTYSGTTATFTPSSNLEYSTSYTATIATGVKDSAGNSLASNYTWSFTTGVAPDTTRPTISSTSPVNGATGISVNSAITATFSENMNSSTISTATFSLDNGVTGSVTYSGTTATFTPSLNLAYSTTYTATITTAAKDAAGNSLAFNYTWSFTTGVAPDTTRPTISSTSPVNGATGISVNSAITATFSENMAASTISTLTFSLNNGVTGSVTYSGTTATFTPSVNLSYLTTYTATITTGVKDGAGNAIAANYAWTFTTGVAPDTIPPTLLSTNPVNGATGVAVTSSILATFSENMDASAISTATFTLSNAATGAVTYSGTTATFDPLANLAYLTTYTATITTGVKDAAGNAMTSNYTWTFTTGNNSNSAQLTWGAPTTNSDGSLLNDLAGYKIYYGTSSGNYTLSVNVGNITTYSFSNLPSGTYYFSVTAYDARGNESPYSNEVSKVL